VVTAVGEALWERLARVGRPLDEAMLKRLSPMLIIAPHQDDETLGCGGLIARAADLRLRPRVAYLTDGGASHTGSPNWPRERLARTRQREALAALAVLGVPEEDVLFAGWPDADPLGPGSAAYERSVSALTAWAEALEVRSLWAPWRGEPHCDHLAAAAVAEDIADRLGGVAVIMSYLVWGWTRPELARAAAPERVFALACADTVGRRRLALSRHSTQTTGLIDDAREAFLIPPDLAALTDRPVEIHLAAP
jgi:LmbE family N-acetylglucosaminyl deacetylase